MKAPSEIQVLVLEGSPRERGQIHGQVLKPLILENINRWKSALQKSTGMNPDEYIARFIEGTDLLAAVTRWTPDLLEEVRGIAEGAGVDFETVFARQLLDEGLWYGLEKRLGIANRNAEQCSGLGVFGQGDSPPLLAQNMDVPGYFDGLQVLLHIKHADSPLESFVFTVAGLIALNGVNNRAIGICCNTLLQLDHAADGLPVAFIVRGVLAQPTLDKAVAFIRHIKHASGQNYIIGGPKEIRDFECSANQVCQFTPYDGAGRVYHTNHALANDDQAMYREMLKKLPPDEKDLPDKALANSQARFSFLESQLSDPSEIIAVEKIKSILSSHQAPVCVDRKKEKGGGLTLGCSIMVLSPSPVLHLAPGPPCSTTFKTFAFSCKSEAMCTEKGGGR